MAAEAAPRTHAADDCQEALRLPLASVGQHFAVRVLNDVCREVHEPRPPPQRPQLHAHVSHHVGLRLRFEALLRMSDLQIPGSHTQQ